MLFNLHSNYKPTGDQPQAIETLVKGFQDGQPQREKAYLRGI